MHHTTIMILNSAIRVLQGRSHHQMFQCKEGLVETLSERKGRRRFTLPTRQIHAMGDDGAQDVLVTLHAYAGSIDDMIVYSTDETLIVVVLVVLGFQK